MEKADVLTKDFIVHPKLVTELLEQVGKAQVVLVHCQCTAIEYEMQVRVWSSTYLIDKGSSVRSRLLHAENISIAPEWTVLPESTTLKFLLVFESLPIGCESFDLFEESPLPCGFYVTNVRRNRDDIYHVRIL